MKKIIFVFVVLFCNFESVIGQTIEIDNVRYSFSGANAVVSKYLGGEGICVIPDKITYNGLDYTVTTVGKSAFYDSSVTEVKLPETITTIGVYAFRYCNKLTKINLPSTLTKVEGAAFANTALIQVIVPESTQFSGNTGVFENCNILRTIIYLGRKAPTNWTATSNTYVPDVSSYSNPSAKINNANVVEMVTFDKTEFEYSGQAPSTTWTNNVGGYSASLSLSSLSGDVGTHEEWIPVTFSNGEETFTTNVVYRYTVKPAKLTAKVNNASREYGEENPQFSISYSGFISGENESVLTTQPTVSTTATKTSNVGDYPITISGGIAKNYEIVYEPGVLTVTKAALSAKVNDATKVYGSANPAFTIEYYGLKNGETAPAWTTSPTFATEASRNSGVGKYEVKAVNGVAKNYDLGEIAAGSLSVTPAPLIIKASDAVRQYYSDEPTFSYTCNGFVNGDDESALTNKPYLSTSATRTSNVGTYEIKVSDASSANYSISNVNGTLTITPRTLTASVGNYERLYNEENPVFEIKYDGFVGSENESVLSAKATASTTATKTSDVGTYPIKVAGGSADNYQFTYVKGSLTINKAEQTISWEQDLSNLKVGDQVELLAKASSGLPITYTMDNNAAEIYTAGKKTYLDCKAGGQFSIRAVQDGNINYYSSPRASNYVAIIGSNPPSDPMLTIKQADNGSVSVPVTKGSVYTFTISPSNGWRVHSVTYNDSDLTSQLSSDGRFTTPAITGNSTLSVVFEEGSSAVNSIRASEVTIQATSIGARVVNANMGDVIRVYTTAGILLQSLKVDAQTIDIPLEKGNVYIVKVGEKTVKLGH